MYKWLPIKFAGIDWDEGNWPKCGKHGVSQTEVEAVFAGEPSVLPDPHPDEPRLRAIGLSVNGRYVFVVFALREIDGQRLIRPISARFMHQEEIDHYENRA
jgi:uncharacterized protein